MEDQLRQPEHHPPPPQPPNADPEAPPLPADHDPNPNPNPPANGEDAKADLHDQEAPGRFGSVRKSVSWNPELVSESPPPVDDVSQRSFNRGVHVDGSNPYVTSSPGLAATRNFSFKETVVSVKDVLGRWGKKMGEATKKAEDLAGNTWQHLKTAPSFSDGALGRIAQGTKVLAEGGYEKIFQQTFETVPDEQLVNSFACYLSTSAGPVMGTLYVSTAKVAFCSDSPLSYKAGDETEWSYYKVVIPLHQLKAVNPSSSRTNSAEKYIQVISVDNHEFWFMGFLNYSNAVTFLLDALRALEV